MLTIQNTTAIPGQTTYAQFHADGLPIPMIIAAGNQPGPTLVLHCAQHRTEYPGSAAAAWMLDNVDFADIQGTVVILPLVDLPAITTTRIPDAYPAQTLDMAQYAGQLRHNINRVWPGDPEGSWVDRLAHAISHEIFLHADAVLDFHSCRLCDGTFTAFLEGHTRSRDLAIAFGAPMIDQAGASHFPPGQLHRAIPKQLDIPAILIETSPSSGFVTKTCRDEMVRGTLNIMKSLGMMKGNPEHHCGQAISRRNDPVHVFRAETMGFFAPRYAPGDLVRKNDIIGSVRSTTTFEVAQQLRAPYDGVVTSAGPNGSMIVLPGEELATMKHAHEILPTSQ